MLRLLCKPPTATQTDSVPPGQTLIWPSDEAAQTRAIFVRSPDGVTVRKPVDPKKLLSTTDEDELAAGIEASLAQLTVLKVVGSDDVLPDMARTEHRPSQRFIIPAHAASSFRVLFNTSKQVVKPDGKTAKTYLDLGATMAPPGPVPPGRLCTVDYGTTQQGCLRHSGDLNYTLETAGMRPGPGEAANEPKLVHTITCTNGAPSSELVFVVGGFDSTPLYQFSGGGVLTVFTTDRLYNVVVEFPIADFGPRTHGMVNGPLSTNILAVRPRADGALVCDVLVPSAWGEKSAPFKNDPGFLKAVMEVPLPPMDVAVPAAVADTKPPPMLPIGPFVHVEHRVDPQVTIQVEMTLRQQAIYAAAMETVLPNSRAVLLVHVNSTVYLPFAVDRGIKAAHLVASIQAAFPAAQLGRLMSDGGYVSNSSLKRHKQTATLSVTVSGVEHGATVEGATIEGATIEGADAEGDYDHLLLWTGVEIDHPLRQVIATAIDPKTKTMHVFSGVGDEVIYQGDTVHLPVAFAGPEGLDGNRALEAATPWKGYLPGQAAHLSRARLLCVAGAMSPGAAACAGPHRAAGVYVMTDNYAPFAVMASPASVLLRTTDRLDTLEWVDGIGGILEGQFETGDKVPLELALRWLDGECANQFDPTVCQHTLSGDTSGFVDPTTGRGCDERRICQLFGELTVPAAGPYELRSVGFPCCHEFEAMLREQQLPCAASAMHEAAATLGGLGSTIPSTDVLVDEACHRAGGQFDQHTSQLRATIECMHQHVTKLRQQRQIWLSIAYQLTWFATPLGRQTILDGLSGGVYKLIPNTPAIEDAPEIARQRRTRKRDLQIKLQVVKFNPADVRTPEQLAMQKTKTHHNAAQAAKKMQIGSNVAEVGQWGAGELADHVDTLCIEENRSAFFQMTQPQMIAIGEGCTPPALELITSPNGAAELAALMEIDGARPPGCPPMLPCLIGSTMGALPSGSVVLAFPLQDAAIRATAPWPNFQVKCIESIGDSKLRPCMLSALGKDRPLPERREQLERLMLVAARACCEASDTTIGQQMARAMVTKLLCFWASGNVPFSWAFEMAQPNGMTNMPKSPEDWERVSALMDMWSATGWSIDIIDRNRTALAARVVQRTVQSLLNGLQKKFASDKKARCSSTPHANNFKLMSAPIKNHFCGQCGQDKPMSRTQRRFVGRSRRGPRRCLDCMEGIATFTNHAQYTDWAAARTNGDEWKAEPLESIADAAAAGNSTAVEAPLFIVTRAVLEATSPGVTPLLAALIPTANPLDAATQYAADLLTEPNATPARRISMARHRLNGASSTGGDMM